MKHRDASALIVVVLVAAWVVMPASLPGDVLFFRDHALIFKRLFSEVIRGYSEGSLPLWDHHAGGGEPLFSSPAAMALSPLFLVFLLPVEFDVKYDLFVISHFFVSIFSTYYFARTIKLTPASSAVVAAAFSLSGIFCSYNSLIPAFSSMAFGPLAIACAVRVVRSPTAAGIACLAIALAVHVQTTDPALLVCDLPVFLLAARDDLATLKKDRRALAQRVTALATSGVIGFLLLGIAVLPLFELLSGSGRGGGFEYEKVATFSLHPLHALELFLPGLSGSLSDNVTFFSSEPDGRLYASSVYGGASLLPLLILGAGDRRARSWLVLAFVFLLIALGRYTPLHEWLVTIVPGLSSSRFPVKYLYGLLFATSVAAGMMIERPEDHKKTFVRSALPITALFCVGAPVLFFGFNAWLEPHLARNQSLTEALPYFASALQHGLIASLVSLSVLALWIFGRIPGERAALLMIAIISVDLAIATRSILVVAPREHFPAPKINAVLKDDARGAPIRIFVYDHFRVPELRTRPSAEEVVRYMVERRAVSFGGDDDVAYVLDPDLNSLRPPHWNAVASTFDRLSEPERLRLLATLGVTHLLVEATTRNIPGLEYRGCAELELGPPICAFRIEGARAYVSTAAALTSTNTATRALEITGVERYSGEVLVEVDTRDDAWLVLAERYDAGWSATVDGEPGSIHRFEPMLQAVHVEKGASRVRFVYRPKSLTRGATLSGVGVAIVIALFVIPRLRRRFRKL